MKLRAFTACLILLAGTVAVFSTTAANAASTRYEAETAPATCAGTIDSNHAGFSGTGFCNGNNAVGAAAQFTVTASAAGTATVGLRYANGTTDNTHFSEYGAGRMADLVVEGVRERNLSLVSYLR